MSGIQSSVSQFWTRRVLSAHVRALGLDKSEAVMVHAGLRSVGRILDGPDALIGAILDVVGSAGTLLAYTDWSDDYHDLLDDEGRIPTSLRGDISPFDSKTSRARRTNGTFAEFVRTYASAIRSENPGASCAAIGGKADWFVAGHALNYGYGEQSPFGKLVEARGKILMVGAPFDSMSILHHAEHKADIANKRIVRYETPFREDGQTVWKTIEEFDTSDPVVEGLPEGYFDEIVEKFLHSGKGAQAKIGNADSILVGADDIVAYGVQWLEARFQHK